MTYIVLKAPLNSNQPTNHCLLSVAITFASAMRFRRRFCGVFI